MRQQTNSIASFKNAGKPNSLPCSSGKNTAADKNHMLQHDKIINIVAAKYAGVYAL